VAPIDLLWLFLIFSSLQPGIRQRWHHPARGAQPEEMTVLPPTHAVESQSCGSGQSITAQVQPLLIETVNESHEPPAAGSHGG
jgi:hypothetical protein